MKTYITLFLLLCCATNDYAQSQGLIYVPDTNVKVIAYGTERPLAWCGGFNNPQFAMGDLNHDGLQDLVVFESGISLRTFINRGFAGNPKYVYEPRYEINFPKVERYLNLTDYNCDNIPDLFTSQSTAGFMIYRGYYNAKNELCFTHYKELYYNNDPHAGGPTYWTNAYNNPGDVPAILDVDNDGDIDFIAFDILGGKLNLYKNMRVEKGYSCDSIVISLADICWGKVYQAFERAHYMATCTAYDSSLMHKGTHSGNALCLFDYEMDGDYDYLDGSVSYNEMVFIKNGMKEWGMTTDSLWVATQDTTWQSTGKSVNLTVFPEAYNVDIDQDGKKDLLISPLNTGDNYKCIWFYKNNTTPGVPSWPYQSDTFLIDKTIDLGTAAYPMLFDYDKDGKQDLFIGSDGYFQSNGTLRSRVSYYKNTSTTGLPSFTLQTTDFLNVNVYNFAGAAPAFGDIDNDGKADMILGHSDGTLTYFKNIATSDSVQPQWVLGQQILRDINSNIITVGDHAAPFIYDIDKDGKKDLLIGGNLGYIQYYQNLNTTPGQINLQLVNRKLGKAKVDPDNSVNNYSTLFIGKMDNTGKEYILMGSNSGNMYRFDGFQTGDTTATYTMIDHQYSFIDSTQNIYNDIYCCFDKLRTAPTVADIDGDGRDEMIIGYITGGLKIYESYYNVGIPNIPGTAAAQINVYPNPAKDVLNVSWTKEFAQGFVQINLMDIQGRTVAQTSVNLAADETSLSIGNLPSGMYICTVRSGNNTIHSKVTIVK